MCNPASFIVTKTKVFWSTTSDRHEDIIEEYGLHADGVRGANLVRVEITPGDGDLSKAPSEWAYNLDQDITPDWYLAERTEKRCRLALKAWIAKKVCRTGLHEISTGCLYAYGSATIVKWRPSVKVTLKTRGAYLVDRSRGKPFGRAGR